MVLSMFFLFLVLDLGAIIFTCVEVSDGSHSNLCPFQTGNGIEMLSGMLGFVL